ncbi:MAG: glycosyltransferase family 39 protein [Chitinophagaceae bacterium]|nr:glycosyltransferase family 39 protein [Chitinophagaceae bacterium]
MYTELHKNGYLKKSSSGFVLAAIIFLLVLRISFISVMGLMPQDAYYYFYSEHPDLSYFDHPPAIAWLLKGFTMIFGTHVFAIKLAATIATGFSMLAFYDLAGSFLDRPQARLALILLFSTFMITVLSLVATPDVMLIFFWTVSLVLLQQAIFKKRKWYWIWSGIAMGLAFDSKYTAIFLPLGVFLFLVFSNAHRKWLASPWPYLSLVIVLLIASPVIIWNMENDFASFRFQSSTRITEIKTILIHPGYFFGTFALQAVLLMPILLFAILRAAWKSFRMYQWKIRRIPAEKLFLLCFFLPVFVGFLLIGFFYWVKLNWIMPAYISGIILASMDFNKKWIKPQLIFSIVLHAVLAVQVLFYPIIIRSDDTWVGWNKLEKETEQLSRKYPGYFIFSADDYKTSAVLNFYFSNMIYGKEIIRQKALEFDYVGTNIHRLAGRNALFIDSDPRMKADYKPVNMPELEQYFAEVKPVDTIRVEKNGRLVRLFYVWACRDYRPDAVKVLGKN